MEIQKSILYKMITCEFITCDVKQEQIVDCVANPCKDNETEDCYTIVLQYKEKNYLFVKYKCNIHTKRLI